MLMSEWSAGLSGLTGEQIGRAIKHCRAELKWPPTIAEFRQAAHDGMDATQRAFAARFAQPAAPLALPSETRAETLAHGSKMAANIRQVLGKREVYRCDADIRAGRWTREMEASFRESCEHLGVEYREPEWPVEAPATSAANQAGIKDPALAASLRFQMPPEADR